MLVPEWGCRDTLGANLQMALSIFNEGQPATYVAKG